MTLLLFLASVAVLEYLLRDVPPKPDRVPQPRETDFPAYAADDHSADLLSLGRALEAQKTGRPADAERLTRTGTRP